MCIYRPWCVCFRVTLPCKCTGDTKLNIAHFLASWPCYLKQSGRGWGMRLGTPFAIKILQEPQTVWWFSERIRMRQLWFSGHTSPIRVSFLLKTYFRDASHRWLTVQKNILQLQWWLGVKRSLLKCMWFIPVSDLPRRLWQRSIMLDEVITENNYCHFHSSNKNCSEINWVTIFESNLV